MPTYEQAIDAICHGEVVVNLGHLDEATKSKLDKMAKDGRISKWRGYWFPIAGAPTGIGPLKTCYAIPPVYEAAKRAGPQAQAAFNSLIEEDNRMRAQRGAALNSLLPT